MTSTTADHSSSGDTPTPSQVRRGRRTALLLFVIGFGPMILATVMFYTGWLNPEEYSNEGQLITPPVAIGDLALLGHDGKPLEHRFGAEQEDRSWLLMVTADQCNRGCKELLYLARQVNIALGKNANRLNRAALVGSVPAKPGKAWSDEYRLTERLQQAPGSNAWPEALGSRSEPAILLIDPLGNIMMKYTSEHTGKQMLKDLKHLLKLSTIG